MLANSDRFIECTTKEEAIHLYTKCLNEIKENACNEYGIESHEFAELFRDEFHSGERRTTPISTAHSKRVSKHEMSQFQVQHINLCFINYVYNQLRRYMYHIVFVAIVFCLVNYRFELTKIFMRNIQMYIYPGMRFWRKLTLPIIRQFPQLTQLYDETCLVSNPFFRVANLDCSPCVDVINVVDLSITPQFSYLGSNIPHIIQQVSAISNKPNKNPVVCIFKMQQQ